MFKSICFSVFFILGYSLSLHAQLVYLPFDDVIGHSNLIVEGEVKSSYTTWDAPRHNIYTIHEVEIFRVFKGDLATPTIKVLTYGGQVGNDLHLVSESAQFATGNRGTFCLSLTPHQFESKDQIWDCLGGGSPHGFFLYDEVNDKVQHPFHPLKGIQTTFYQNVSYISKEPIQVINDVKIPESKGNKPDVVAIPIITSFSPTSLPAGCGAGLTGDCSSTNSTLTINGSNFGTYAAGGKIEMTNADFGGGFFTIDLSDTVSWNSNKIVIRTPSASAASFGAGTGKVKITNSTNETGTSPTDLTVTWRYTNLSGTPKRGGKLVVDNGNGGMTFTMSTSLCNAGDQDAVNAFGRAFRSWRCTGVNWQIASSTTASVAIANDDVNIVTFDQGTALTGGILGRTTSRYSGCNSPAQWSLNEIDVNLDEQTNWYYCDAAGGIGGSQYDFESVCVHELGHGHQLGHIIDASAVMHFAISNNQIKRTLNGPESTGVDCIFGQDPNTCGPGEMTELTNPACLNVEFPGACNAGTSCTADLPVEWLGFNGRLSGDVVLLDWATAFERDNDFFAIQRSANGTVFQTIGNTPAKVSLRNNGNEYFHTDYAPLKGMNYYRLAQHDKNGDVHFSNVVAVFNSSENQGITLAPNPSGHKDVSLQFKGFDAEETFDVRIFDLMGRLISRYDIKDGQTTFNLPVAQWQQGVYHVEVLGSNGFKAVQRLVIQQ